MEEGLNPLEIPSPQTFLHVWRTQFPHLKIPRHNTLGVCGTCLQLKEDIRRLPSRSPTQQNLRAAFKEHLWQVKQERHAQIQRDQSAASFPVDSWTITTDFMQDLFQPYLCHRPKSWFLFFSSTFSNLRRFKLKFLPLKVFGYINSGTGQRYILFGKSFYLDLFRFYVYYLQYWPHNANTHISLLYQYIKEELRNHIRPKVLYLQFDNCSKDNKNRYF